MARAAVVEVCAIVFVVGQALEMFEREHWVLIPSMLEHKGKVQS